MRSTINLNVIAEGTWSSASQRCTVLTAFQTLLDSTETKNLEFKSDPCGTYTKDRSGLIGSPGWRELADILTREQFGDFFVCFRPQGPQQFNLWVGLRPTGANCFTPREVVILTTIYNSVAWLPAVPTTALSLPDISHLPHRVRVAFCHFRTGKSTKEIAEQMGISHHTVVDYFKRIYRHFGVCSGRELLALLLANGDLPPGDSEPD